MTLRKEKLEGFRRQLLGRREVLATELRQATADFINDDASYTDSIDQAVADAEKSLIHQMKSRDRSILSQIDAALKRIDAGTFGECIQCGDEILEARIKAAPFATLCIDCKSELESEEHRPGRIAV